MIFWGNRTTKGKALRSIGTSLVRGWEIDPKEVDLALSLVKGWTRDKSFFPSERKQIHLMYKRLKELKNGKPPLRHRATQHDIDRKASRRKRATEDARWFKGEITKALQILQDACDIADMPGGLSSYNGSVEAAVYDIRRGISGALAKHERAIR